MTTFAAVTRRAEAADPGGVEAISRGSRSAPPVEDLKLTKSTPEGSKHGCDPFGVVGTYIWTATPDALRDPGLIADIPPGCGGLLRAA
jgi:hypothetical protein